MKQCVKQHHNALPVNTFWGSERINHPALVHAWYRGPIGCNGWQCMEEWFSHYFFLLQERFFGFLPLYFPVFFPLVREGFLGFNFFYVLRFFCIFFLFYLGEVGVFWNSLISVEFRSISGQISPQGGQVLHLAGLTTRIGGWLMSNHSNILYIAV